MTRLDGLLLDVVKGINYRMNRGCIFKNLKQSQKGTGHGESKISSWVTSKLGQNVTCHHLGEF
jgi:hypothetical protein